MHLLMFTDLNYHSFQKLMYLFPPLFSSGLHRDAVWPSDGRVLQHGLLLSSLRSASVRHRTVELRQQACLRMTVTEVVQRHSHAAEQSKMAAHSGSRETTPPDELELPQICLQRCTIDTTDLRGNGQ